MNLGWVELYSGGHSSLWICCHSVITQCLQAKLNCWCAIDSFIWLFKKYQNRIFLSPCLLRLTSFPVNSMLVCLVRSSVSRSRISRGFVYLENQNTKILRVHPHTWAWILCTCTLENITKWLKIKDLSLSFNMICNMRGSMKEKAHKSSFQNICHKCPK